MRHTGIIAVFSVDCRKYLARSGENAEKTWEFPTIFGKILKKCNKFIEIAAPCEIVGKLEAFKSSTLSWKWHGI